MSRSQSHGLFTLVQSYFTEYLPRQRGASTHTIRAYRDALTLLFKFVSEQNHRGVASLELADLDANIVTRFLDHIEAERSNSPATRNCRRAAIRGFFKHLLRNDLTHSQQYIRVLAIPTKKARQQPSTYLEAEDSRLIISMPDKRTSAGWRDYTLLLFLYNCGARVSEAAGLRWNDLQLVAPRQVRLHGKGKKERLLPLWPETANALHRLRGISRSDDEQCVFVNRQGQPLTRDGIAYILSKYATAATHYNPTLRQKHITPHVLRHSCAVALLQSGTDVTVIRDYLGHTSVATTSRYITTNLQMKREAMQAFWKKAGIKPTSTKPWKPKADLLTFLQSL
ncbi:site-specific integrase [Paraburkholderia hospita]|uniref:site-specific integrase n=3 Tax=Paraburkholderia hospita TaxID=169430 RepID=UPI0008A799A7|nr:site-specific integrase [Paraburkholderia hospita]OUL92431.1 integrase [Paraburkholderia hospita]SEI28640.1 Site-specific recombinase XerD [Paraburkholderia hospita]SOE87709.1 Site-specific recombinase XerD [Burkholderia sp. YR290]